MKRKHKLIRTAFLLAVLLYFLYKLIYGVFIRPPDTQIVRFGEVSTEQEYQCIIVRDEKIVKSPSEGIIKYYVEEGEKVDRDYKVSEIYTSSVDEKDKEKLEDLHHRIDEIESTKGNMFKVDVEKIDNEINLIIDNLRKARIQEDFQQIRQLHVSLENKIDKKRRVSGDKSFSGSNLSKLQSEKVLLETKIKNSILGINSPGSGIVSYYVDGYEELLTPSNLSNIKYDFIKEMKPSLEKLKYDKVIYNQPVFKITDNTAWYILIITDSNDSDTFKKGKKISMDFPSERITGSVVDKINDESKSFIIVKTNQFENDFNRLRKLNLNVVKEQYEGLKIHKDSIVERDSELGVFLLSVNRKAIFRPIEILGHDDEYAIVKSNEFERKEGDTVKRVKTLKLYDEILRHGAKYEEGDTVF